MEETQRQKKIGNLIQKDLANILDAMVRDGIAKNLLISITRVRVSIDLSIAKVYLSIFPSDKADSVLQEIRPHRKNIKHQLSVLLKQQLRKLPELVYYIDDSLDYIEHIEQSLKAPENPIENPDLLDKRKRL